MTDFEHQVLCSLVSNESDFAPLLLSIADICREIDNETTDDAACATRWGKRADAVLAAYNVVEAIK